MATSAWIELPLESGGSGSGTVTSVALTVPSFLSVSGSPITTSGTLAITLSGTALPILNGGTGQTTKGAAFDALSPTTTKGDLIAFDTGTNVRVAVGTDGQVLSADSTQSSGLKWIAVSGTGTVTSVALTVPSFLSVAGSPVTTSGTLAITLATETANTVFAGPTSGGAAIPTFRSVVAADIPTLNQNTTGTSSNVTGTVAIANGGTGQTTANPAFNALSPLTTKGDILGFSTVNARLPVGTNGQVLSADSTQTLGVKWIAAGGTGTVTSVDMSVPAFLSVSGNPITTTGTLAVTLSGTALPIANGGTNSTTSLSNNRVMKSSGGAIIEAAAITAARALKSDANGIPVASTATATSLDALSGTNTGDQTITLTGDVTGSGTGSFAATISVGAVTDTKGSLLNKPAVAVVQTSNQTLSGLPTIDGVATAANTLVLLTAQTSGSQNGPWTAQSGAWVRPTWYPAGGTTQALQFMTTFVRLGTTYQGSVWRQTAAGPFTIDTDATTWAISPLALNSNTVIGALPVANGGSGQTTSSAAFGTFSPLTTKGDLLGFSTLNVRFPIGTDGQVLSADSTQTAGIKWISAGGTGTVTSVALTVPSFLSVSGSPITTTGTLAVTLSGTALPVANGGTGATTLTANNVILGNGTSAVAFVAPGTSGNLLTSNGTTWTSAAPAVPATDVQEFTTSGTWTKPTGAKWVSIVLVGAGGGGGGGQSANAGAGKTGGSGGGGGSFGEKRLAAADISTSTVTVTVGAAGTAGSGGGTSAANGTAGGVGGDSSFGIYMTMYGGGGGSGGNGGASRSGGSGAGTAGDGAVGVATTVNGGFPNAGTGVGIAGGGAGVSATAAVGQPAEYGGGSGGGGNGSAVGKNGGTSIFGGGGGGSGGGTTSGGVFEIGGDGGNSGTYITQGAGGGGGGAGGTTAGSSGSGAGVTVPYNGFGGGGGASGNTTSLSGGNGGAGAIYGGGGGGGGASISGGTAVAGTGGAGSAGIVIVTTYF